MRKIIVIGLMAAFAIFASIVPAAASWPTSTAGIELPKLRSEAMKKAPGDESGGCWWDERGQLVCFRCSLDFWSTEVHCYPIFGYMPAYTFDGRCAPSESEQELVYDCFYRRHSGNYVDAVRQKFPEMLRATSIFFYLPPLDLALSRLFNFLPDRSPSTPEAYVCALLSKQNYGPHEDGVDFYEDEERDRQYAGGISPKRLYRQIGEGSDGIQLRARKLADYHRYRLEVTHLSSFSGRKVVLWSDPVMVLGDRCTT